MKQYVFFSLFISFFILSCKQKEVSKKEINSKQIPIKKEFNQLTKSELKSEGAYFFQGKNQLIINWTETHKEQNSNLLKFAIFNPKTKKFNTEISVPIAKGLQLHAESMAKVGKTKDGTVFAFYRRRSKNPASRFGGLMFYTSSKDNGKTWSKEKKLVADKKSTSQSFFDIALLPDGEIGIIWLDSRKPIDKKHKGKTLFFAKTNSKNGTIENEKPIAGSTCECCRTDLFVDSKGVMHVAYRNIIDKNEKGFSGKDETEIRDMFYLFSKNNGKTFSKPVVLSKDDWHFYGCPHTGPSLAESNTLIGATWYTGAPDNDGIFFSTKNDSIFQNKKLLTKTGYHPQMTGTNQGFFVVYEEYYEKEGKGYNLIQLEKIKANQSIKEEVSQKLTENDHPVISKINNNQLIIAWVNKNTRNPKIMYTIYHTN